MIVPGDVIEDHPLVMGPGVYEDHDRAIPTVAGYYHTQKRKQGLVAYVESAGKHYVPHLHDMVVGIVVGTIGESYKVQLQDFCQPVLLSFYAFANATKKNRPQLKQGQAVYARISQAIPEIDIEIECVDAAGKDGGFGPLDDQGMVVDIGNLAYARELLFNHKLLVLEHLATKCKFEVAVGTNGKAWIRAGDAANPNLRGTIAVANYVVEMQHHPAEDAAEVLDRVWAQYQVDEDVDHE